jgi:putative phosphoribosyl transferase
METIRKACMQVDEFIVLATPDPFWAVGHHYIDFAQVSDHDVVEYLNLAEESLLGWKEQPQSSTASPPR